MGKLYHKNTITIATKLLLLLDVSPEYNEVTSYHVFIDSKMRIYINILNLLAPVSRPLSQTDEILIKLINC